VRACDLLVRGFRSTMWYYRSSDARTTPFIRALLSLFGGKATVVLAALLRFKVSWVRAWGLRSVVLGGAGGAYDRSREGYLSESGAETVPPALVVRLPPELALGLGVRGAADLRHHRDADVAAGKFAEPDRHVPGRLGANRPRQFRQPGRDRRRLVVDDVVDTRLAALDRRDRRRSDGEGEDALRDSPRAIVS
jgi:hypothetical protein